MTMKRIVISWIRFECCRDLRGPTNTSNETGQNRHENRESRKPPGAKHLPATGGV